MVAIAIPVENSLSRDELILHHLPQVRIIATRIYRGVPRSVSIDDLISAGIVGLIAAIDRYSSVHGVKLKTYAEHKIRGAILDSLRVLDWAPRQKRRRAKLIENTVSFLEKQLERTPDEEEIAEELGLSIAQYQDWKAETNGMTITSLEYGDAEKGSGSLLRFIFEAEEHSPSNVLERSEMQRLLKAAVKELPTTEQTVLALYFEEELTLREIAKVVDVHESRVSQLKTQALLRLRNQLKTDRPATGVASRDLLSRAA